jgi:hypothetical protein
LIRVALRGLGGRKLRASLTALAIILGVAMMSGTYVLTDTIDKAFSSIFDESYAETDVVVSGRGADIDFQGMSATAPPIESRAPGPTPTARSSSMQGPPTARVTRSATRSRSRRFSRSRTSSSSASRSSAT